MSRFVVEGNKITAVADAIRNKTDTSAAMTLDEMPDLIESIETGTETPSIDLAKCMRTGVFPSEYIRNNGYHDYIDNEFILSSDFAFGVYKKNGEFTYKTLYQGLKVRINYYAYTDGSSSLTLLSYYDHAVFASQTKQFIIESGSGAFIASSWDVEKTDTSDGTITPQTVLEGEVGYSQGERIVGEYVPPAPSYDTPSITVSSGGLITASANGKSNTKQMTTKAATTITPTKSEQTAVNSGVYTTGAVKVGAIPSNYIIPSGSQTVTKNGTVDVTSLAELVVNVSSSGGLPSGFTAIATGTHTLSSDVAGGSTFNVTHNLGQVPDLFMIYTQTNIATTYSMLMAMRSGHFAWRGSTYLNKCFYHGNSTTTVTGADVTTSYGIKTLSTTTATVTTYSSSGSYYWRSGIYKWIAIKF